MSGKKTISNAAMTLLVNLPAFGEDGHTPANWDEYKLLAGELGGFCVREGDRYWRAYTGDVLIGVHSDYLDAIERVKQTDDFYLDWVPMEQA